MNPKAALKKAADEAREMHRLYPFTKTVTSAATARSRREKDASKS